MGRSFPKGRGEVRRPVAIHADNYALWDSAHTQWDALERETKGVDFVGDQRQLFLPSGDN